MLGIQLIVLRLSRGGGGVFTFLVVQIVASVVGAMFGFRANPRAALMSVVVGFLPILVAWFLVGVHWGYFDYP